MQRIVAVGASAGGVSALEKLVSGLPANFPAAVLVVLHLPVGYKSLLPDILTRAGPLAAVSASDGEPLLPGRIYVAVPDAHLTVEDRRVRVIKGPRENGFRPSVDVLFRSAAYGWGSRAVGVVLSGALDDGASGLWAIKQLGGVTVVQHPEDAAYDSMPVHALRRTDVDHTVPAAALGPLLDTVVRGAVPEQPADATALLRVLKTDLDVAAGASALKKGVMDLKPTSYTCPDCHGVLFEIGEGDHRRFRCHTGHGYTLKPLLARLMEGSETRLWDAARAVQEAVALLQEAASALEAAGQSSAAQEMLAKAEHAKRKLDMLRGLPLAQGGLGKEPEMP